MEEPRPEPRADRPEVERRVLNDAQSIVEAAVSGDCDVWLEPHSYGDDDTRVPRPLPVHPMSAEIEELDRSVFLKDDQIGTWTCPYDITDEVDVRETAHGEHLAVKRRRWWWPR